jgi:hypothetical protein
MLPWCEFEAAAPAMARAGRALLNQTGVGLAYLATVRPDGGPRLHPICPLIVAGGLYTYIGHSPKRADLLRDGRYALHTLCPADVDDEFYLTGRARFVDDAAMRAAVSAEVARQGWTHGDDDLLFELQIECAMHAAYPCRGPGCFPPTYHRWSAP